MNDNVVDPLTDPADQVRALLDHRYRSASSYQVDRETIRDFARAVQNFHSAHWNVAAAAQLGYHELIAPPTFASIILLRVHREIVDTLITGYDSARVLHADQVLDFGRPLLAGDRVTCDTYFESFRHFADYDVLAIKTVLIDQHGEVVQTGSTALLARTGRGGLELANQVRTMALRQRGARRPAGFVVAADGDSIAPASSNRSPCPTVPFETLTVGTELPVRVVRLSRTDLRSYAEVTGDATGLGEHHRLGERQQAAGDVPTVVAPGVLKIGLAAGFLGSWLGDPGAITRFRAQFAHCTHNLNIPASGAGAIEFRGRVTVLDAHRRKATIAVDARSKGRKLFGYAAAEVRFPDADPAAPSSPADRASLRCESSRAARS